MGKHVISENDILDTTPIRLSDAARLFFAGSLTSTSLRTEIRNGNLEAVRIAGKDFVTKNAVTEMLDKCRVRPKAQGSTYAKTANQKCGSSGMEAKPSERDMLKARLNKPN